MDHSGHAVDLPALRSLVGRTAPTDPTRLVLVTHVLRTAVPYIEILSNVFDVEVVAIPYSRELAALRELAAGGHALRVPSTLDAVPRMALDAVLDATRRGMPAVVQEVGGYLASCAASLGEHSLFRGIVEDTNNGHWRYEAAAVPLAYPVVSIARSPIKAMEDRQVGRAVAYSIERLLRETFFQNCTRLTCLIVGYGSIGAACAEALRGRVCTLQVFDVDPVRTACAALDGYEVKGIGEAMSQADLIIGATGQCSLSLSQLAQVKKGALVVSASSKQVEIDMAGLRTEYRSEPVGDAVRLYEKGSHHLYVANDGYPVNFRDQSVLGAALDAIYSELFICTRAVALGQAPPGLLASWPQIHQEVAEVWCETYVTAFKPSTAMRGTGSDVRILQPPVDGSDVVKEHAHREAVNERPG